MKKFITKFTLLSFLLTSIAFNLHAKPTPKDNSLTIAYAANLEYAIKDMEVIFQKKYPQIKLVLLSGSSGKHTAQIRNGAPVDIFLSADVDFPQKLADDGLSLGKPKIYAYGTLVLWTLSPDLSLDSELQVLLSPKVKKIAIANPKLAPYGKATVEALEKKQLLSKVEGKFVYAENIGATTQYVATRATELGFVPKSAVLAPSLAGQGKWMEVDASLYSPIAQAMIILPYAQANGHLKNARLFFNFLESAESREIFKKYGYGLPK